MNDTLISTALFLIVILLLVQVVRSERRRQRPTIHWPKDLPIFYEVDKLSDLPPQAYLAGTLVNVRLGIGSRGVHMHNGKEFVKVEQHVCPTCGK